MQRIVLILTSILLTSTSFATDVISLRQAIEHAAVNNPTVLASWHSFEAANEGRRAAKGGYLPSVDLSAEIGSERTNDTQDIENDFNSHSARLTITQMLFDGFATKHEVAKQGFVKLARYYEFKQASEEVALETAQAYLDITRYKNLTELAKENLIQHRRYHRDIEERVNSGLGRGVDLEQARARLALAESNLLTETTNLHDVTTRFYRLVGLFPANNLADINVPEILIPDIREDALKQAFVSNPQLNAAIENIRIANADLRSKNAPMMPRFDLRFRKQIDENDRGIDGQYDEEAIELVMTYNLYRGGSDKARKRQANYLSFEAKDNRERVCREVRQTVSIAHNDISSKGRLIDYLEQNVEAISKARVAYQKQFDIGQRTLLDLLDTENEYFEVRRTLVSAKSEHTLASLRTLAGMGLLMSSLDVDEIDDEIKRELNLARDKSLSAKCPAIGPAMIDMNVNTVDLTKNAIPTSTPGNDLVIQLDVKFELQSATLSSDETPDIEEAAKLLCKHPNKKGFVEGHTDSQGSEDYNFKLSIARAITVKNKIASICNSAKNRLKAVGYGELRPIANNDTFEGRKKNRRVELVIPTLTPTDF